MRSLPAVFLNLADRVIEGNSNCYLRTWVAKYKNIPKDHRNILQVERINVRQGKTKSYCLKEF